MSDPDHRLVARVVAAISDRSQAEGAALAAALAARWSCSDRHDRSAGEWLRRWSPRPAQLPPPSCSCAAGRRVVCN